MGFEGKYILLTEAKMSIILYTPYRFHFIYILYSTFEHRCVFAIVEMGYLVPRGKRNRVSLCSLRMLLVLIVQFWGLT